MSNKKKNNKNAASAEHTPAFKPNAKTIARILAGGLAALMVLGSITMTIMYFMESFHVH